MDWIAENKSGLLMAVGVLMIVVVLLRQWSRYFRRTRKDNSTIVHQGEKMRTTTPPEHTIRLNDYLVELDRQKVQMYEVARDFQAEVDTRIRVLQQYTVMAEELSERLEKAIRRAEELGIDRKNEIS